MWKTRLYLLTAKDVSGDQLLLEVIRASWDENKFCVIDAADENATGFIFDLETEDQLERNFKNTGAVLVKKDEKPVIATNKLTIAALNSPLTKKGYIVPPS